MRCLMAALAALGLGTALASGDVTVLFTNDTHTHIDDGAITFAQIAAERDRRVAAGETVILVDAGDFAQGTAYGKVDAGASVVELMNRTGYQVAAVGNHEFDIGVTNLLKLATERSAFPFVACNFWRTNRVAGVREDVLPAYHVVTTATARVAFVGVATPETLTFSTPTQFMDASGSYFLYGFDGGADGGALYRRVQAAVDAAAREAEAVIVLSHLGFSGAEAPWTSPALIAHLTNCVAVIDGHSHSVVDREVADAAGRSVRLVQTGAYLKGLGVLHLKDGAVVGSERLTALGATNEAVAACERRLSARVEAWLGAKIAVATHELSRFRSDGLYGETGLGDFVADAFYWYANARAETGCDVALCNYAGIRANVTPGDVSLRTANDVCPFANRTCVLEMTGAVLTEALEWGARRAPEYLGCFLHCAGMRYQVATSVVSTVRSENGKWAGPPTGSRRVRNVEVYDRAAQAFRPLDPARTYRVAGGSFTLRACGEGFEMLRDCRVVSESVGTDYLVLSDYMKAFAPDATGRPSLRSVASPLNVLADYLLAYESPEGAGRIRW